MTQFTIPCPNCDSLYQIKSNRSSICGDCGTFVAEIYQPCQSNSQKFNIGQMLRSPNLNSWENFFLRNIQNKKYLTLKQQEKLSQISQKINQT